MELTTRQIEVLKRLANGKVAKEIGLELEISPRTVELHYTLMRAKLGAKTLPQLIHIAHQKKIL